MPNQHNAPKSRAYQAKQVLELRQRLRQVMLSSCFDKQRAMIEDPSRLKAAICTRRAGKSYGAGLYLVLEALLTPRVTCLYITRTRQQALQIMYKDILEVISRKYKLGLEFRYSNLQVKFPNGSILYLLGMDASESEKEKALGQKYKLVVIDEAGSFQQDVKEIIDSVLRPACVDLQGTILMQGTPRSNTTTFFHDVTNTDKHPEWSVHRFSGYDNPYIRQEWDSEIKAMQKKNPLITTTPFFIQEYLGQWCINPDDKVYAYDSARNAVDPEMMVTFRNKLAEKGWAYGLGVDFGYKAPSAFVLVAYNEYDPRVYLVEAYKQQYMTADDIGIRIQDYMRRYPNLGKIVGDPAEPRIFDHIRSKYQIPVVPAEKLGKVANIELLNADFISKRILAVEQDCQPLIEELRTLVWDDRRKKIKEDETCPNHCTDAMLYICRAIAHYHITEMAKPIEPGTPEHRSEIEQALIKKYTDQKQQRDEWDIGVDQW